METENNETTAENKAAEETTGAPATEPKVVNLKDILNRKTEDKPESKPEEPPAEPDPAKKEEAADGKKLALDPEAVADNLIDLVDGIQQISMPFVYSMALFTKTERGILKQIAKVAREQAAKNKGKNFTIEYTQEQGLLLEDYAEYEEYCNELPFSPKEINLIKKPLVEVIKESKFTMTPKGALLSAATLLMVPRTLPILLKKAGQMFGMK